MDDDDYYTEDFFGSQESTHDSVDGQLTHYEYEHPIIKKMKQQK